MVNDDKKQLSPLLAKMNPVSAAAAGGIMVVELDAAQREAALKLPKQQAIHDLQKLARAQLDFALFHCIQHQLGREPTPADLGGGDFEVLSCQEPDYEGDIYALRGEPLLWAGPVALQFSDDSVSMNRPLLLLNGAPAIDPELWKTVGHDE